MAISINPYGPHTNDGYEMLLWLIVLNRRTSGAGAVCVSCIWLTLRAFVAWKISVPAEAVWSPQRSPETPECAELCVSSLLPFQWVLSLGTNIQPVLELIASSPQWVLPEQQGLPFSSSCELLGQKHFLTLKNQSCLPLHSASGVLPEVLLCG